MVKVLLTIAITGVFLSSNAQDVLFATDFNTKPADFAAASVVATSTAKDNPLLDSNYVMANQVYTRVMDQCTLSIGNITSTILISKASAVAPAGDVGASNGRLILKNSYCAISTPPVNGPCTITYFAAPNGNTTIRTLNGFVNGIATPELGVKLIQTIITDIAATKKVTYTANVSGPVSFKLSASGGSIQIYDIIITSADPSAVINKSAFRNKQSNFKIAGSTIVNDKNKQIQIYTSTGARVLKSDKSIVNVQSLINGTYLISSGETAQKITINR